MSEFHLARCVAVLRAGGVIAHATEGVWGLACDPLDPAAVARVVQLKHRPPRRGFILIAADPAEFDAELDELTDAKRKQVLTSWPAADAKAGAKAQPAVTQILPNRTYPIWVSPQNAAAATGRQRQATLAARVTGHPQARALCERFGGALLSTSANPSGRVAATSALRVQHYFAGALDYLLPGAVLVPGAPSGIRDARSGEWLREPPKSAKPRKPRSKR